MLPKKIRLPLRQQVTFFETAAKLKTKHLVLFWNRSTENRQQFAVIVPKKRFPKAALRSQVRRKVEAAVMQYVVQQEKSSQLHIVIYVLKLPKQGAVALLQKELATAITSIGEKE